MSGTQTPEILELLSEIDARDLGVKGDDLLDHVELQGYDDLRGYTVLNTTGHDVGIVDDLYVDPNTRAPQYALLNLGKNNLGLGNRRVLVRYDDVDVAGERQVRVRVAVA